MKYQGAKGKFADELLPILLKDRREDQYYVEPFCGSASLLAKVEGNRLGNDIQPYLIAFLRDLSQGIFPKMRITLEEYSLMALIYKQFGHNLSAAGLFYTPSQMGFCGFALALYGKFFSSPVRSKLQKEQGLFVVNVELVKEHWEGLLNVTFVRGQYYDLKIPPGSIIYCDPPYLNTSCGYGKRNFDRERFYAWCFKVKAQGHRVFISEKEMPRGFAEIWAKPVISAIKSYEYTEKLFTIL